MHNISQFARKVGVAVKTLLRWDRERWLAAHRTLTNCRYYTEDDLALGLNRQTAMEDDQSAQN